jgi:hypothetical protein
MQTGACQVLNRTLFSSAIANKGLYYTNARVLREFCLMRRYLAEASSPPAKCMRAILR